jgi:hypothetical protein
MNKKITATLAIAIFVLSSMAFLAPASAAPSSQPILKGSQWAVYEQRTLPNGNLLFYPTHADTISGGVQFQFPDATASAPAYVNYMLDTYTTSLTELSTISATIRVSASSGAVVFAGNPDGGNPSNTFVRLFIQANLPSDGTASCVGGNKNVNNYWWADVSSYTFVTGGSGGVITLTASLNNANWSGICGNPASSNSPAFDVALANIKYVGLSFGSGSFFANGVGVDGTTGSAVLILTDYTISS